MCKGRRRWTSQRKKRERDIAFPPCFVLFKPSVGWVTPSAIGRAGCFSHSTDSQANLFQKLPPMMLWIWTWAPLAGNLIGENFLKAGLKFFPLKRICVCSAMHLRVHLTAFEIM